MGGEVEGEVWWEANINHFTLAKMQVVCDFTETECTLKFIEI